MLPYVPVQRARTACRLGISYLLASVLLGGCHEPGADPGAPHAQHDATVTASIAPDAGADAAPAVEPIVDTGPGREGDGGVRAALDASARADATSPASEPDAARADAAATPDAAPDGAPASAERSMDFAVGTRRIEIQSDGGRVLPVQLWYPARDEAAAEAEAGHGIESFEPQGARRTKLLELIKDSSAGCPNLTMHAALDAAPYPRSAALPLLVYSHHFNGARFSMFTIAEGLARAGMVVAAPDHVGGSLFERQDAVADALGQFNETFLRTRVADLRRVLDVLLEPSSEVVPEGLRGRLDPARVAALGHSLGGITVGVLSAEDTRVRASAYLAIQPSPSLAGLLVALPAVERFRTPALYLSAHEDSVVETLGGSGELAATFEGQTPRAYWVDVRDSGHFSFGDLCGLVPDFAEGCGSGTRVAGGETFTYLEPKRARAIASHYVTLFFASELTGAARTKLSEAEPAELVTIKQHEARSASAQR